MPKERDYSVDELMIWTLAQEFPDGQLIGEGANTPLGLAALLLAKLTHAKDATYVSGVGLTVDTAAYPLSLTRTEYMVATRSRARWDMRDDFSAFERGDYRVVLVAPAQVDRYGNTNNSVIGEYRRPRVRLPGGAGLPDVAAVQEKIIIYTTRHSPRTVVSRVDFISGPGFLDGGDARRRAGLTRGAPHRIVTNLGVFGFDPASGEAVLTSVHPGVTVPHVQDATGFPLRVAPDLAETPEPPLDAVRLIRERVDPLEIRKLEFVPAREREQLLRAILDRELEG